MLSEGSHGFSYPQLHWQCVPRGNPIVYILVHIQQRQNDWNWHVNKTTTWGRSFDSCPITPTSHQNLWAILSYTTYYSIYIIIYNHFLEYLHVCWRISLAVRSPWSNQGPKNQPPRGVVRVLPGFAQHFMPLFPAGWSPDFTNKIQYTLWLLNIAMGNGP